MLTRKCTWTITSEIGKTVLKSVLFYGAKNAMGAIKIKEEGSVSDKMLDAGNYF